MVAILGSGIISWPNQDGCIVKESILVPHHVQVQTSWASLVQAFGLQLTQHITNDACLVYGPPVKKLCLKWCKSCLESIFLAFAGPERANAFQYIPILCFWMLLDPWDSHGMNETWIIYDYMKLYGYFRSCDVSKALCFAILDSEIHCCMQHHDEDVFTERQRFTTGA